MQAMQVHPQYPTHMISPEGKVWGVKREFWLSHKVTPNGYCQYTLCFNSTKKTLYIHRLVADLFCDKPSGCNQVNHKDGNKKNNHYTNLEWVTAKENRQHAFDTGLQAMPKGDLSHNTKYPSSVRKRVQVLRESGLLHREIAILTGMSRANVGLILHAMKDADTSATTSP